MPSLLDKLRDVPLAVVDVETTGSSARCGDRVTELGIAVVEDGRVTQTFQQLVNPCRRISPGVVALTGITDAMVADQPRFGEIIDAALDVCRGKVLVGHNVGFDLSFLDAEFSIAGRNLHHALAGAQVLDTVRLARKIRGRGGNGLQRLAMNYGIVVDAAHRALADCLTTAAVLEHLLRPTGFDTPFVDVLNLQGGSTQLADRSRSSPPPTATLPLELQEALASRRPVRMAYLDARQKMTERVIEPMDVRQGRRSEDATLVGFCHLRQEMRTFKLERIVRFTRIESDEGVSV